jgi:acetyl-CoA acetyltransferase
MPDVAPLVIPTASAGFSRRAAIVGIGETDFHLDYREARRPPPGYEPPTPETMVQTAFDRALADANLSREDIDGLSVSFTYGGPEPAAVARLLGITPDYLISNGNIMAGPLPVVCADIAGGRARTVAMVYAVASRAIGRQYGGTTYTEQAQTPSSYYYYHPWGWSSQAAHWAMVFSHYQATYGVTEADLGAVAMQVRSHASTHANSVMQMPMSLGDYLQSRYIVRPLHLFDLCVVNDGAVCLIVTERSRARERPHQPVLVAGWGHAKVKANKMHCMIRERWRHQMQDAGSQAFHMADLALADVGHLEAYDASSMHLINQLEGYGFAEQGAGLQFCKEGHMARTGRLPCNTSGGNLSGSYMHGWSQIVEIVRQLRHEAGHRQIKDIGVSMFSLSQTDQSHPILFTRE